MVEQYPSICSFATVEKKLERAALADADEEKKRDEIIKDLYAVMKESYEPRSAMEKKPFSQFHMVPSMEFRSTDERLNIRMREQIRKMVMETEVLCTL